MPSNLIFGKTWDLVPTKGERGLTIPSYYQFFPKLDFPSIRNKIQNIKSKFFHSIEYAKFSRIVHSKEFEEYHSK